MISYINYYVYRLELTESVLKSNPFSPMFRDARANLSERGVGVGEGVGVGRWYLPDSLTLSTFGPLPPSPHKHTHTHTHTPPVGLRFSNHSAMDQIVIQANFVPNCGTINLAILIPLSPSKGDTLLLNLPYVNLSLWYSL